MKKPTLRFDCFTDEWKASPFGSLAKRASTSNAREELPRIEYEDIIAGTGLLNKDLLAKRSKKKGLEFHKGDVLYGKLRPYLHNWFLPSFTGLAVGDFWVLQPQGIDSAFLYRLVQSHGFDSIANQSAGSKMPRADWKLVANSEFRVPVDEKEQAAIGAFFSELDALIEGKRAKLDKLKKLKLAYLGKMFPKKGSRVPEVRFKGFTGGWKEVEFGSILEECLDRSVQENEDTLLSSSIEGMFLNSELFGHQRGASNKGYRKLQRNMLVLSAQNLHLGNANVNLRFEHGLVSPAYKIYFIKGCSPLFLSAWIKKEETKHFFLMATTEGASGCRKNVEWNYLYKQQLFIPVCDEEQTQVGAFFQNLDNLINLQQQELDKLANIKSACLSKMFA